ncbi:hypothetical protein RND71_018510 [Anisodus tanguticus]|uniref:Uncharacterized protein n=1 Tax=Anisodus tanguticus TaxID=243964 RepID=A0AAE1S2U5_9SOLA|nr:hypothetical protein RND71_018510 [Anisodus tanguticus]
MERSRIDGQPPGESDVHRPGTESERDTTARGPESNRASKSVFCLAYDFIPRVRRKKTQRRGIAPRGTSLSKEISKGAKNLSGSSYYILNLLSISTVDAIEALNAISGGEDIPATIIGVDGKETGEGEMVVIRALFGNNENIVQCREGDNVLRSGYLPGDGYGNPPQMGREYKGDLYLLRLLIREYRPN